MRQLIISGVAAPGFAFVAATRWAAGQWGWFALWLLVAVLHAAIFVMELRARKKPA